MDDEAWRAFHDALTKDLRRRGWKFSISDEAVLVEGPVKRTLGLQNLVQICGAERQYSAWPALIAEHVDHIEASTAQAIGANARLADVERILKVRLYPEEQAPFGVEGIVAPGIRWALVYDLPDAIQTVPADHVAAWSTDLPELLKIGYRNVRESDPPQRIRRHPLQDGGEFVTIDGPSFFTATHALWIDEYVPEADPHGILVVVPDRHNVMAAAITNATSVMATVGRMLDLAGKFHRVGPGSISKDLYWFREGRFTLLPSWFENGTLQFAPTVAFKEVLNELAGPE